MELVGVLFRIIGSLGLFLYGMKVMSDGIQRTAGTRMRQILGFMTGNRFSAVATGLAVTAIIQSSSAATVMVVSFVNAGLLTLTQAIGVIMGANIGTTITAWIVSLVGFSLKISSLALPAVGIGFVMWIVRWKRQDLGEVLLGFGLLFLGLDFLTRSMPSLDAGSPILEGIGRVSDLGFLSTLIGTGIGLVMTLITHSSSASTAIMLTMAHSGLVSYQLAASMILGANIGTTIDAALAAIGAKPAAKQAALVHILFNVIGTIWALIFFRPLLGLVNIITPGEIAGAGITTHLAMFHTVFNVINTLLFFPFVKRFAALVSFLIKDTAIKNDGLPLGPYRLEFKSSALQAAPELNIPRAEKEIRDMAGIVSSMYARISEVLFSLRKKENWEATVDALVAELRDKEAYADQMREELTRFLMECTRRQLTPRTESNVSQLLRIIADLEDMTDACYGISLLLERSAKKGMLFHAAEMEALAPYVRLVEEFLAFVREHLGSRISEEQRLHARSLEDKIDKHRNRLKKMGRKRIEAGENVKTELLFIDLVRRIEGVGDYCYNISSALSQMG